MIAISHTLATPSFYDAAKRAIDIAVSATLLIFLAPLFAIISLCILLTDGRPIFYTQWRVGMHGRMFRFLKFRSMINNAEVMAAKLAGMNETGGVIFKIKNDPRVTLVGRWLRRFSLDELPQLIHVLNGEMTLVGPRPAKPGEIFQYRIRDLERLSVPQGLTCIWQVSGRSELPFKTQIKLDLAYIRDRSLWLDIKILLQTIPAVFSGRGAY
jgi:lipopolysaccharide/colanic/teichoic acid biosynthesis glycosyltransferase